MIIPESYIGREQTFVKHQLLENAFTIAIGTGNGSHSTAACSEKNRSVLEIG